MSAIYRPTAAAVGMAFACSGRRHLFITGSKGSGKTTLLSQLMPSPQCGIVTRAEPGQAVYLRELQTGQTVQVGRFCADIQGAENKMRPLPQGFDVAGVAALERCARAEGEQVYIDEIGYLETTSVAYCAAVRALMAQKQVFAAVRKQELPFLHELLTREDVFTIDLDAPYGNLGCVIMASGMGRRFGSNKLLADFDGAPLFARSLAVTEGIFARRAVVTRHADIARYCAARGIEAVLHDLPHRSDTVRLGLEAVGDVDGCLFCPADQPLLRQDTVAALAMAAVHDGRVIMRPAYEGAQGAPVLFPARMFSALRTLPEGVGGGHVIRQYPDCVRTVAVCDGYELADVDTPEDLRSLQNRI